VAPWNKLERNVQLDGGSNGLLFVRFLRRHFLLLKDRSKHHHFRQNSNFRPFKLHCQIFRFNEIGRRQKIDGRLGHPEFFGQTSDHLPAEGTDLNFIVLDHLACDVDEFTDLDERI
jgi:hypothetical protein